MILGYSISGPDNNSYLNEKFYGKDICECINYVRNREKHIASEFEVKNNNYDFSNTYDNATIVSQRFKDFCVRQSFKNIKFYKINNTYYVLSQ